MTNALPDAVLAKLHAVFPDLAAADLHAILERVLSGERVAIADKVLSVQTDRHGQAIALGCTVLGDLTQVVFQIHLPEPIDLLPAALERLATLPLETIPEPRMDLPARSHLDFRPNPNFVGRAAAFRDLAAALKRHQTAILTPAVAVGVGGIGKTSLAVEFVYRYGWYFAGGIFWINSADPTQIASHVAACAPALGIDPRGMPLDEQVHQVLLAWQAAMPRLIVVDNCDDAKVIDGWLPAIGGCRVLITSRSDQWASVPLVRVGLLSPRESRALVQRLCARLTDIEADAIAEDVGYLPLALHLAGSYLTAYSHHTVEQYRKDLTIAHRSLKGRGALRSPTRHEQDIEATFMLSFNQLDPTNALDALALGMLDGAAWCAPGVPIPRDLVLAFVPDETDADDAVDALRRLQQLGLLDGADAVVLHRLLAQVVEARLGSTETLAMVEDRIDAVASRVNEMGVPRSMLSLEPHLRHTTTRALKRGDALAALLANNLGYFEALRGAYADAQPLYERALAIREAVLRADHPDTAQSVNNLASVLLHQGRYADAQSLFERALAVRETVLGADHPDTATSVNNLAFVLERQGRYADAQPLFERALAIREAVLGADHPATAVSVNNLAGVLLRQGRYADAQPLFERALAIYEAVLGADHPDTAVSVNNLAGVLDRQGRYADAQPLYERALAIREAVLGADHPDTAQSVNNLAMVLASQGRYADAQPLHERALGIYEAVLGADHPATAVSVNNLAGGLARQGRYADAQPLFERALAIYEAVLGADHPDTQFIRANLVSLQATMTADDHL